MIFNFLLVRHSKQGLFGQKGTGFKILPSLSLCLVLGLRFRKLDFELVDCIVMLFDMTQSPYPTPTQDLSLARILSSEKPLALQTERSLFTSCVHATSLHCRCRSCSPSNYSEVGTALFRSWLFVEAHRLFVCFRLNVTSHLSSAEIRFEVGADGYAQSNICRTLIRRRRPPR